VNGEIQCSHSETAHVMWSVSNELDILCRNRVSPGSSTREREVIVHDLGSMEIIRADCGAGPVPLFADQKTGAARGSYGFLLVLRGNARLRHYGPECVLGAGDFVLINSAAPHGFHFAEPGALMILRVAPRVLRTYLPAPESFCGRPLRPGDGISESAAELMLSIFSQLDGGLDIEFRSRVVRNLLDTLATAFSMVLGEALEASPVICNLNARVRLYIERNLRDPDLKPSTIASSLRLSPRYLRAIFATNKETVSAFMLRRRLEECARELANRRCDHLSITQIAFGWGFNSGPHFTRSFHERFGVSPRTYRRMHRETPSKDVQPSGAAPSYG